MAKITPKQKAFVEEYLIDLNATRAAKRAKYKDPNYGRVLTAKTHVWKAIERAMEKRAIRTEITQDKVLEEIAKIGFANITDFLEYKTALRIIDYDDNNNPIYDWGVMVVTKDSENVDGAAISEVSVSKDGTFKFKLYDKLNALDKLARHLNIYTGQSVDEETINKVNDILGGVESAI